MNRITVRIDDLIGQLNELKRDGAEKVLLEIEEGVAGGTQTPPPQRRRHFRACDP